jgi:hypothetical protein
MLGIISMRPVDGTRLHNLLDIACQNWQFEFNAVYVAGPSGLNADVAAWAFKKNIACTTLDPKGTLLFSPRNSNSPRNYSQCKQVLARASHVLVFIHESDKQLAQLLEAVGAQNKSIVEITLPLI